jgi:hypothetical protein
MNERRDWSWDKHGTLTGRYAGTRQVRIKQGPSAGQVKVVVDFEVGNETVTVWPPTVLKRQLKDELQLRRKGDFEPLEKITIVPKGRRDGANGSYWDFEDPRFEFAAAKPSAATLLAGDEVLDEVYPPRPADVDPGGQYGDDAPWDD